MSASLELLEDHAHGPLEAQHNDDDPVYYSARSIANFYAMYRAHQNTSIAQIAQQPTLQACRTHAEQDSVQAMHDATELLANTAHALAKITCSPAAAKAVGAVGALPMSHVADAAKSCRAPDKLPASKIESAIRTVRQHEEALCAEYAPGLAAFLGPRHAKKCERECLHNMTNIRA